MQQMKINANQHFIQSAWQGMDDSNGNCLRAALCSFLVVEAYGLVGVYTTLQSLSMFLDLGLSTTISRELAHYSIKGNLAQEMANLFRMLEVIYWSIGIWTVEFLQDGLTGLQRFTLLNVINSIMITVRNVGVVLILWLVSPTIQAFFTWQIPTRLAQAGDVWHAGADTMRAN